MNLLEMALTINPIAFEIGGLQVRWYGIIIAFGIYLATTLADREATRKGYRKDFIIDWYSGQCLLDLLEQDCITFFLNGNII